MSQLMILLLMLLAAAPGFAQTPAPGTPPLLPTPFLTIDDSSWETRIFQLRYVEPESLSPLLELFLAKVTPQSQLNAIAVKAPPQILPAIEDAVTRFDVPANATKSVSMTIYLILASPQTSGAAEPVPPALAPVLDQLRKVLTYQSYRVLDTMIGSGIEGETLQFAGTPGKLTDSDPAPLFYNLSSRLRVSGAESDLTIRFADLNFMAGVHIAGVGQRNHPISTSLDVKPGQQVVIGKTSVLDKALILVVSADVVD